MKLLWSSDTHLNLSKAKKIKEFCDSVKESGADGLLISGDISESDRLHEHLSLLSEKIDVPIYFVIGNHDYYKNSIAKVNNKLSHFIGSHPKKNLVWMTEAGLVELTPKTCLIGGENWWDGQYGDIKKQGFLQELIMRQDYKEIADLCVSKDKRVAKIKEISDEFLKHFKQVLPEAIEKYDNVYLLTHVPPFRESCSYQAMQLHDEWLFHFCCRSMGDYLLEVMKQNKTKSLTVMCGHTHTATYYKPLSNLTVLVASASYLKPKIYTTICVE